MAQTITYSRLVSIILKELNKFRENPLFLLDLLEDRSQKYQDNLYYPNADRHIQITTQQGEKPVRQLINLIKMKQIYTKLIWSYELHCAANQRAESLSESYAQLEGDQMPIEILVNEYANWGGNLSEHILYGFCDPRQILCELLIDDGNFERQNRKQIMNPNMHYIGIGFHRHEKYKFVMVMILATQVDKKNRRVHYQRQESTPVCEECQIF